MIYYLNITQAIWRHSRTLKGPFTGWNICFLFTNGRLWTLNLCFILPARLWFCFFLFYFLCNHTVLKANSDTFNLPEYMLQSVLHTLEIHLIFWSEPDGLPLWIIDSGLSCNSLLLPTKSVSHPWDVSRSASSHRSQNESWLKLIGFQIFFFLVWFIILFCGPPVVW